MTDRLEDGGDRPSVEWNSDSRVVVIQTGFLGDAVLASGLLRRLHDAGARDIGVVVRREAADLFAGHPAVGGLHVMDKSSRGATGRMAGELSERGYEIAVIPHRSLRSAWMARQARIGRRIGFRQSAAPWLLTDRVEYTIGAHELDRNDALLHAAGIREYSRPSSWLVPLPDRVERQLQLLSGEKTVVIAPGSVWATKRWTERGYAEVARAAAGEGYAVRMVGGPTERALCLRVAREAGLPERCVVAGELDLADTLALVSIAERVVSNDSAPLHIAESVGVPVTAIFGPTVPAFGFGVRGDRSHVVEIESLSCRPCRIHGGDRCPIGTHDCMRRIDSAAIVDTL